MERGHAGLAFHVSALLLSRQNDDTTEKESKLRPLIQSGSALASGQSAASLAILTDSTAKLYKILVIDTLSW
jgi:hypothetical protein